MPQDLALPPNTPVTTADVTNAANRNLSLSEIAGRMSDSSDAVIASLGALAAAVTADIIGGSTGTTDNLLLRAKGTGGRALDASPVSCSDAGLMVFPSAGALQTSTSAGNTLLLQARDVDGAAYTTFITLTANNTPTCALSSAVSWGAITSSTNVALLDTTNVWTKQQGYPMVTLTDAATVTWDGQTQQTAKVTLGGNRTLGAISNQVAGFTYILLVIQDGTGNRTLAYNSNYLFPGGTDPVLSTAAGAKDVLTFMSDGTNMYGVIQKAFA